MIKIRGARTHNLKNVDVDLPRDKLIVITGLSGSGKSSLAFDTLYAEGQRRYVESLSAYARQFLSLMEKPDVDLIEGLSPAIAIEQKSVSHNPRSTVGTITEIHDYLRLLYARVGEPFCPEHGNTLKAQTITQMVDAILQLKPDTKIMLLAPIIQNRKGEHAQLIEDCRSQGFARLRVNGKVMPLDFSFALNAKQKNTVEIVIDRLKVRESIELRLAESLETCLRLGNDMAMVSLMDDEEAEPLVFSARYACPICGYSVPELEPRMFSFNNPMGACSSCDGLGSRQAADPDLLIVNPEASLADGAIPGWDKRSKWGYHLMEAVAAHYEFDLHTPYQDLPEDIRQIILYGTGRTKIKSTYVTQRGRRYERSKVFEGVLANIERRYQDTESNAIRDDLAQYLSQSDCPDCQGTRLNLAARHVRVGTEVLPSISERSIDDVYAYFQTLKLPKQQSQIAEKIIHEIQSRLHFLISVGLNYLSLNRTADTLSGGETQRIRLASQIGSGLVGVMYVLDEPSIGLHQRDNQRLLNTLFHLRDLGNTVIVVEHDEEAIRAADHVIDIGPGAGRHGGNVTAEGPLNALLKNPDSLTTQYLSGKKTIPVPKQRLDYDPKRVIRIMGARANNLKNVDANIPVGLMTCVTGVSGSGKSSLIKSTLMPAAALKLDRATRSKPGPHDQITGLGELDKSIAINQNPIGRTPRSNPATYTGMFTTIRELFAATEEARSRGYTPGRFSFNVRGGRCEACEGDGVIRVEMHFLADVHVTCEHCQGKRYNRETLEVLYKGRSIADVLSMTVEEALDFFSAVPVLARKLQTLMDVGLSYIQLGQSATTLSGGEAQRIKLSKELSKRSTGRTLYILDEPTTGLHFHDIKQLLEVLHRLRDNGNTVVVIEHNLDVIKTADWIIDLGPEGGAGGGEIIAYGTPESLAKNKQSHTGRFLKDMLA